MSHRCERGVGNSGRILESTGHVQNSIGHFRVRLKGIYRG